MKVWVRSEALGPVAAAYVQILALCGNRRTETALARWTELELDAKNDRGEPVPAWVIPPENRKGRAGKKRGLVVPLSPQAVEIFRELKRTTSTSEWIFSADRHSNISTNFGRLGAAVKKATRVDFSFHDLRATCATGCGRLGAAPHVVALVLGHQGVPGTPSVTSRYDRADRVPEVRQALDRWGRHVEALIEGDRSRETDLRSSLGKGHEGVTAQVRDQEAGGSSPPAPTTLPQPVREVGTPVA